VEGVVGGEREEGIGECKGVAGEGKDRGVVEGRV